MEQQAASSQGPAHSRPAAPQRNKMMTTMMKRTSSWRRCCKRLSGRRLRSAGPRLSSLRTRVRVPDLPCPETAFAQAEQACWAGAPAGSEVPSAASGGSEDSGGSAGLAALMNGVALAAAAFEPSAVRISSLTHCHADTGADAAVDCIGKGGPRTIQPLAGVLAKLLQRKQTAIHRCPCTAAICVCARDSGALRACWQGTRT